MVSRKKKTHVVLIADDDEDDLMFAQMAIRAHAVGKIDFEVRIVRNGEDLLDYLHQRNEFNEENAPKPSVIFLDIKMPKIDGLKALEEIKNDKKTKAIPIIILSSSESDIDNGYIIGANSYIVKPNIYQDLEDIMGKMKRFWFDAARIPGEMEK